jgi:DNA mismatch repair protein MutL
MESQLTSAESSRTISRLPELLINQIAAGEVVERPSNVVKELVENSLDAGSTRIDVQLKEGGMDEVVVIDNGLGIELADLPLAVERHATSKIRRVEDLEAISTFGFRGEALSSISSVSHLEIISRTRLSPSGYQIVLDYGKLLDTPKVVSSPVGTQVRVSQLFAHTPARLKFLRSVQTELSHCNRMMRELALGNPTVKFFLQHNDRSLGSWLSPSRKERFKECLKTHWNPLEIREEREDMLFEAFLSPPQHAQSRSELYLFINGRPVRNRGFLSAIRNGFLEGAGPGHEPIGACYLDIRKDWVDVNVHPQKWEVRCLQQEAIYQWLLASVRKHFVRSSSFSAPSFSALSDSSAPAPRLSEAKTFPAPPPQTKTSPPPSPSRMHLEPKTAALPFKYIGCTGHWLLAEDSESLLVGDLALLEEHALARILLQDWKQRAWTSEKLAIPKICRLDPSKTSVAQEQSSFLKEWGFETEFYGDGDFAVLSRPSFLNDSSLESVFSSLIEQLSQGDFKDQLKNDPSFFISCLVKAYFSSKASRSFFVNDSLLNQLALELTNQSQFKPCAFYRISLSTLNKHFGKAHL